MHAEILEILRCPQTARRLSLQAADYCDGRVRSGWLVVEDSDHRYPIREFIPRFAPESNYADNFGMQWNKFRQTQLDSYSGRPITASRFWKSTGWQSADMVDRWVLDAVAALGGLRKSPSRQERRSLHWTTPAPWMPAMRICDITRICTWYRVTSMLCRS